ncbi:MAG: hypothetical protein ACFE8M_09610 [Candidatus Hermodarchaeota archaeon]
MLCKSSFNYKRLIYLLALIILFCSFFYPILFTNSDLIDRTDKLPDDQLSKIDSSSLDPPYIESSTITKETFGVYNFDVDMPSVRPDGDLYIAQIAMDDDALFSSTPSGWTEIENGIRNGIGPDVRFATYWRIGDSEPVSYTWSCSTPRLWIGAIHRISGFDSNNPIHTSGIITGESAYPVAPSITTTVDDCLILRMFGADDNNIYSFYWPYGTTPIFQDNCGFDSVMSAAAYHIKDTAGFINNAQFRMSYSARWVGISIAIAPLPDITPPTYSNLVESSDPLELGDTEIININVTDPSGISHVLIEFEGLNHTMTNVSGDMWEYNLWKPNSIGIKSYTIWMNDTSNNWNFTTGSISVIDTTAPTYSDLIESADPLQLGQNETITIKAYDIPGTGINQVLLEYQDGLDFKNHTMKSAGVNTWSWNNWMPSLGIHSYKIYIEDIENNWNVTKVYNITVIDTTGPVVGNLSKTTESLELGDNITIYIDAVDEQGVSTVLIKLENINYTMIYVINHTYKITWTKNSVGIVIFTIYANDTENNWNSLTSSFDIIDTTKPAFVSLTESQDLLELGETVTISVNATDLAGIKQAKIAYAGHNYTMWNIPLGGETWLYDIWTPQKTGIHFYTIWIEDKNNNWNFTIGNITVQDTISPAFFNLTENYDPIELGEDLIITIIVSDLSDIKRVLIEFESENHSMVNIGGDLWQYDSWRPDLANNYSYTIHMIDNNNNYNFTKGSIKFQDTIPPVFSNLIENADPLELGDTAIITINIDDIGGINRTLIEFQGSNHNMTNLYGSFWQYNSWIPNNWTIYQYKIYMEDRSGNSNFVIDNITVQDTTPPAPPIITNAPSGDVSGTLMFDWQDGSDPSGISSYILIIDNESDPYAKSGFVCSFNILNNGSESSFFELTEPLVNGRYYYFLYQIDGVGHQSEHTMGTFNIISVGDPGLMNLIIISVILVSIIGVSLTIIIARKKLKKEILPPRKKIPLKTIISHINKISSSKPSSVKKGALEKKVGYTSEKTLNKKISIDEDTLKNRIDRIRLFGIELFAEGAYLEAQKEFEFAEKILLKLGRKEEALEFLDLHIGIKELVEEREKKLKLLESEKLEEDTLSLFDVYNDLIELSLRLKDVDMADMYQSELIQLFQSDKLKLKDLEYKRFILYKEANSLIDEALFEKSIKLYEKCRKISELLVKLGRENETKNIEKFKTIINGCLKKASQSNNNRSES